MGSILFLKSCAWFLAAFIVFTLIGKYVFQWSLEKSTRYAISLDMVALLIAWWFVGAKSNSFKETAYILFGIALAAFCVIMIKEQKRRLETKIREEKED